ncbi:MAG: ATP-binding cassette domain-containing protein [Chloroflexi bacterium]|nr:ATP-binding cassette domain-containing protein [Chloroflexota bacterium]MCL5275464.1 ATP-binding cassette domain-containing protein [Chloroflexota bacterium]
MNAQLNHIYKSFGAVQANVDVSLTVQSGAIHGLLGENGAGKSTLVKMLSGFITRDAGEILLDDKPAEVRTPADGIRAGVGMLHQDPLDFPPMTVLDNFVAGKAGGLFLNRRDAVQEFKILADQFNFALDVDEQMGNLTIGERQQLEILRLLSLGVSTLILDEPTTGISASQKTALFDALRKLAGQGKSIVFVSHKLEDVEELCNQVTVMRAGHVVGTVDIPCPTSTLVSMMFGRELAAPVKPPTCQADIAMRIQGLTIGDDRIDVQVADLTVRRGEVIGLAGLEGSGQRLFLLTCAGVLRPATGKLYIRDANGLCEMTGKPYHQYQTSGVGYLPADRLREGLIWGLSIQEHVVLRTSSSGLFIDREASRQVADQAIQKFNIRGKADTRVGQLSGGNQQRTQLALLPSPLNLVLLEHPTRGLDIESTIWVWQQLIERCRNGTSIIFASSDLDEIVQYSDRVIVFSGGKVSTPIETTALTAGKLGEMIGGKFGNNGNSAYAGVN